MQSIKIKKFNILLSELDNKYNVIVFLHNLLSNLKSSKFDDLLHSNTLVSVHLLHSHI